MRILWIALLAGVLLTLGACASKSTTCKPCAKAQPVVGWQRAEAPSAPSGVMP